MKSSYGVDKAGYIVSAVSSKKIQPQYSELIKEVKSQIKEELGDKMHSLYLYGSVANGKAKRKTSDIDFLLVLKRKPSKILSGDIKLLTQSLTEKHTNLVREVGISVGSLADLKGDPHGFGCFLKHLCIHLTGENLVKILPKYRPTKQVARAFNADVGGIIKKYKLLIQKTTNKKEVALFGSQISRKFLRTGFSLVMTREKSWTTDLNNSYRAFAKYYPEHAMDMKKALIFSTNPTTDSKLILNFMDTFGRWLVKEVKKELT